MRFNMTNARVATLIAEDTVIEFEVTTATEKIAKSGKPMIELILQTWHEGERFSFREYLTQASGWRMSAFKKSVGIESDDGREDCLSADECEGRTGRCVMGILPAAGDFSAKNKVKRYLEKLSDDERLDIKSDAAPQAAGKAWSATRNQESQPNYFPEKITGLKEKIADLKSTIGAIPEDDVPF